MSDQGVMRIGEVHAQLRLDYPEIELSKIRYYEDKGLVQPSRSRKGYRLYSERDVQCLREAIRLAQEEFVPLRVVRVRLIEQGLLKDTPVTTSPRHAARDATTNVVSMAAPESAPAARPALKVVVAPTALGDDDPGADEVQYCSATEFQDRTGLDPATILHLQSLGLLAPVSIDRQTTFTTFDLRVADVVQLLLQRGVDARLLAPLRRVGERELGVVEDVTQPLWAKGSDVSMEKARTISEEVAAEVARLRAVLYERSLADYLDR